ncbi:HNH endonuclease signature motif containing protein [Psychrosphaera sp. 1_MG-2023]|uniref:HNH endonuclease signature motif containing protein n=1 Tax=Psychrosphaera sp. 1_MG-2023 TaxID=3062643 RepID=UPI0026E3CA91|nr:HNH endonuclease signature motif containing protein [Psychrosphaera sp. 1_MG-2023]MDO6718849.1 HNH endonuclease signature motif containing protein [Psychrosphaera sp. 1_MG-2023]
MKSGRVYNKAMLQFLEENFKDMFTKELTEAFNKKFGKKKTVGQIKACLNNHGIKAGVRRNRTPRRYLNEHLTFLQKHYLTMNLEELTAAFNNEFPKFNANIKSIRACLRNHKILSGRTGHFVPGEDSWNKGMKGLNTGGEAGWFKKGARSLNQKPVGSERVNVVGYIEIKVSDPNKWRLKNRVLWEQANGPLSSDDVITFIDNNPLNCVLDNLMKISRAQHAVINKMGLANVQPEAKETTALIASVVMKTNEVRHG